MIYTERIESVAQSIYALIPDGGHQLRPTTASDQDGQGIYEKVFVPDPWEGLREERKEECREMARAADRATLVGIRDPDEAMLERGGVAINLRETKQANQLDTWPHYRELARASHKAIIDKLLEDK